MVREYRLRKKKYNRKKMSARPKTAPPVASPMTVTRVLSELAATAGTPLRTTVGVGALTGGSWESVEPETSVA